MGEGGGMEIGERWLRRVMQTLDSAKNAQRVQVRLLLSRLRAFLGRVPASHAWHIRFQGKIRPMLLKADAIGGSRGWYLGDSVYRLIDI
jgi:hypothetical protein